MLVSARLVTSDDGVIELAHEALARAWPRLRTWLEEDVDGQRVRHHVAFAADAWDALGRPDSEVYRGVRLSTALEWRRTSEAALTTTERDFLDRGERVADAERVAAAERAHVQQRTNRRLRGLLVVASALVVATLVAGLLAVRQARNADVARGTAEGARERADAAALTADSRRLGARALTTDDISLSLLLAVQGVKLESTPESRADLLAALAKRPQLIRTGFGDGRHITSLAVRPLADSWRHVKGSVSRWAIAASNGGNDVVTFDQAVDRMSSRHLSGHRRGGDLSVAYSPDGSMLAAGMNTPDRAPVQIIDAIRNRPLARQLPTLAGPAAVTDITFSGDGRSVAATFHAPPAPGASDRAGGATRSADFALVWNPRRGDNPHRVDLPSGLHGLAVSKDARTVYTSWPLTAYDVSTSRQLWRSPLRGLQHLDLNRAGTLLTMPEWDDAKNNNVVLVDARTGELRRRLVGHREQTGDVRFSPAGSTVASLANDNTVLIWDAQRGRVLDRLEAGTVNAVAFSPDGRKLVTGGEDSAVRVWDLRGEERYVARTGTGQPVPVVDGRVHPSPDGRVIAYLWHPSDGRGYLLRFYDVASKTLGRPIRTGDRDAAGTGSWRPDRMRYATTGYRGRPSVEPRDEPRRG